MRIYTIKTSANRQLITVTITFSVSTINLKNITDETTDSSRFLALKNKTKHKTRISFPALPRRRQAHTASADVSVDTDMVTLAILTVLLMQLSVAL